MSSLLAALGNDASEYTLAGIVAHRMGSDHPSVAPYGLFAAADADLALAVGNDRQFRELADVLGAPGLAEDARFSTNAERVANLPVLRHRRPGLHRHADSTEAGHARLDPMRDPP